MFDLRAVKDIRSELAKRVFEGKKLPDTLYHYTDATGLLGILQDRKFRATHYKHFNDSKEVEFGDDLAVRLLHDRLNGHCDKRLSRIYQACLGEKYGGHASVIRTFDCDFYIASFCDEGDLLDQWRAYGADGSGYAMGIDPKALRAKVEGVVLLPTDGIAFVPVEYDEERQRAHLEFVLDRMTEAFQEQFDQVHDRDVEPFCGRAAQELVNALLNLTVMYKHVAYKSEREWRVIKVKWGREIEAVADDDALTGVHFRVQSSRIVPYVNLDFSDRADETIVPLRNIVLGPKNNDEAAVMTLHMLLKSLGYSGNRRLENLITLSTIPYQ